MPRIGSLFSGYGGLDMAVQAVYGGHLAWYSEIDKHACTVLEAHHPGVPNLGDITAVDWADVPPIDILTGGYPCQPFSHAGQRKGTKDERHLWPYVRDAIVALRPVVTVLENVDGHRSLGLDAVLGDLADLGLSARWGVVRAADAGAPHGRKRVFIRIAQDSTRGVGREGQGWGLPQPERSAGLAASDCHGPAADASGDGLQHADQRVGGHGAIAVKGRGGAPADATDLRHQRSRTARDGWAGPSDSGVPTADATSGRSGSLRASRSSQAGAATRLGRNGELPAVDAPSAERRGAQREHLGETAGSAAESGERAGTDWGKYAPAIRRWESLTRPAPDPTIPGTNGRPRLSPAFVEWMMGLPAGHVTGHDLKPAACLKMLGNGVVPQQAELALRMLAATDA